jgi:hypothetical protein
MELYEKTNKENNVNFLTDDVKKITKGIENMIFLQDQITFNNN